MTCKRRGKGIRGTGSGPATVVLWSLASFKLRPKTSEAVIGAYKWGKTVPNSGGAAWEPTSSNVCRRLCVDSRSDVDDCICFVGSDRSFLNQWLYQLLHQTLQLCHRESTTSWKFWVTSKTAASLTGSATYAVYVLCSMKLQSYSAISWALVL